MKRGLCFVGLFLILSVSLFKPSHACSAFLINAGDGPLVAKNYDWNIGDGLVIVNKRTVWKPLSLTSQTAGEGWTSIYGSVTFNQYGRDLPQGGMNEAGLVIEVLWLTGTEYPPDDERTDIGGAQWIQYQLDTAGSVKDLLKSFETVQIRTQVPLHFFVADRKGETATVEFVDGKSVYHVSKDMPVRVLTNSTYSSSIAYLKQHQGFGGSTPIPQGMMSLDRFVRAAVGASGYTPSDQSPVDYAYSVLGSVAQDTGTQWSIVYDVERQRIYFRTHESPSTKYINLGELDFSCSQPAQIIDIDLKAEGSVNAYWKPYTRAANLDLLDRTYAATSFLQNIPQSTKEAVASYPDRSRCME
jgi:penicillin V acylase-like amidase (Ntn superfamily)